MACFASIPFAVQISGIPLVSKGRGDTITTAGPMVGLEELTRAQGPCSFVTLGGSYNSEKAVVCDPQCEKTEPSGVLPKHRAAADEYDNEKVKVEGIFDDLADYVVNEGFCQGRTSSQLIFRSWIGLVEVLPSMPWAVRPGVEHGLAGVEHGLRLVLRQ